MQSQALQDSFGLSQLQHVASSSSLPTNQHIQPPSFRTDKGKARAHDMSQDDISFSLEPSVGSSRSISVIHDTGSNKARTDSNKLELESTNSIPLLDGKGKQRDRDSESANQLPRTNLTRSDEGSLKRSIRELGSSPSTSPQLLFQPLPYVGPSQPLPLSNTGTSTFRAPIGSTGGCSPAAASSTNPDNLHKKRRSLRLPLSDYERNQISISQPVDLDASNIQSNEPVTSLGLSTTATSTSTSRPSSSSNESTSGIRPHVRRASLLVNSSTSGAQSFGNSSTFCISPEPMDPQHRPADLIPIDPHSGSLQSTRTHRPGSTITRRRGFYVRDPDPPRPTVNYRTIDVPSTSESQASATTDTLMSDFTRAVDLLLGQSDSTQTRDSRLPDNSISRQNTTLQATSDLRLHIPPQLPHVRAASPLTISFSSTGRDEQTQNAPREDRRSEFRRRMLAHQAEQVHNRSGSASLLSAQAGPSSTHTASLWPSAERWTDNFAFAQDENARGETHSTTSSAIEFYDRFRAEMDHLRLAREEYARRELHRASPTPREMYDRFRVAMSSQTTEPRAAAEQSGDVQTRSGYEEHLFNRQDSGVGRPAFGTGVGRGNNPMAQEAWAVENSRSATTVHHAAHAYDRQAAQSADDHPNAPRRRAQFQLHARRRSRFNDEDRRTAAANTAMASLRFAEASRHVPIGSSSTQSSRSALGYLGRLVNYDNQLDGWTTAGVSEYLRSAMETGAPVSSAQGFHRHPASTSSTHSIPSLFDHRDFITDEEWARISTYEGLMELSDRLGAELNRVPQSLIDSFPTCEYGMWDGGSCRGREDSVSPRLQGKGKGKAEPKRDVMCPICRDDYVDSDVLMSINRCDHAFHAECIKAWFKKAKTCPMCRADVFDALELPKLDVPELALPEFEFQGRSGNEGVNAGVGWGLDL